MNSLGTSSIKMACGLFVIAVAWFALITQWCITTFGFVDFISFFTIQCNLLVALCVSFSLLLPHSAPGRFFSKSSVQSAIALYIFIVGLVYNTVLRGLYEFKGMQRVVDNLLHVWVPVLYIMYWYAFTSHTFFRWKQCLYWLIYPLLYTMYSMIRGSFVHWYPYPFLNAQDLGYPKVFVNMLAVLAAFCITGLIVIGINRRAKEKAV